MPNYIISFCGVHGSGKTTLEILLANRYNLLIPPKQNLFPLRMINYEGILSYLHNYYNQLNHIEQYDRDIITSRFGILDVLIYTEALFGLTKIDQSEKIKILFQCEKMIPLWPLPKHIINLTANIDVLFNRLKTRDLEYNNGIVRDINKINYIRANFKIIDLTLSRQN